MNQESRIKDIARNSLFVLRASGKSKGFTIVEMIVALGLFTVVVLAVVGSLTALSGANARAQAASEAVNNLNFAVESITRFMRTGSKYQCPAGDSVDPNCPDSGETSISFTSDEGDQVVFRLNGSQIERSVNGGAFLGVTSPAVQIDTFRFFVRGAELQGDQPFALLLIEGSVDGKERERANFAVQASVSQRILDL